MKRPSPRYSRRRVLRGLGLGTAALPLLDLELDAQAAGPPRRLVTMVWPNGVTRAWWPTGGETDFALGDAMAALKPIRDDIVIVDDMQLRAFQDEHPGEGGHTSFGQLLAGGGGSLSVDQHVANVHARKYNTAFPSLVIGIDNKEETKPRLKWVSFNPSPVPYQDDPYKLYAKLFGGAQPGAPTTNEALVKLRAERRSILDFVGRDLQRFGANLAIEDRQKCDAHLATIRDIERQLDGLSVTAPSGPPTIEQGLNPYDKRSYDKLAKVQLDTVVAALAAHSTTVVTLCWNSSHNNVWVFYWLGEEFSQPGRGEFNRLRNHHEIAHHGGSGDDHRRKNIIDNWFMSQMTYLALELKKRPEAGGTLLDSSLLFWANCMEDGGSHATNRMPFVLAGRAGGALKTGRYVRQGRRVPHNGLLVSIANMMEAPTANLGPAKYGGALSNL